MRVWLGFWNRAPNSAHPDWVYGDGILIYDHEPRGTETTFLWLSVDVADLNEAYALYGRDFGIPRARLDVETLKAAVPSEAAKIANISIPEPMDATDEIPHLDKMDIWNSCADVNADAVKNMGLPGGK